jgi:hypothetical protein
MAQTTASPGGHQSGFLKTFRTDTWWVGPTTTIAVLGFFGLYMTVVACMASYYHAGPYLSPFYSPLLFVKEGVNGGAPVGDALIGPWPSWWPSFIPASPAFFIIPLPTMFRGTCYYYRKAYYRSFFGWPPACAVGSMEYPGAYKGESGLLLFQNLHRYTFYIALLLLPFLWWEAAKAFMLDGSPGIGIGSILLTVNAGLLTLYTFGCHSFRHLIGGKLNCFSCDAESEARGSAWLGASWLNARHMNFAWASLIWFLVTDIFIRLLSLGAIPDVNTWHGVTWMGQF